MRSSPQLGVPQAHCAGRGRQAGCAATRLLAAAAAGALAAAAARYAGAAWTAGHLAGLGSQLTAASRTASTAAEAPRLPRAEADAAGDAAGGQRRGAAALLVGSVAGLLGAAVGLGAAAPPARAAKATRQDLDRLKKGYKRIVYLLDNFEEETTVCNPDCIRTPDKVREYLGLKDLRDPLFNIDKMLVNATDFVNPDMIDDYQEAIEKWGSAVAGVNGESFISSFGEYNPGGGKAQVERYIDRARDQAVLAKTQLEVICKALDVDIKG